MKGKKVDGKADTLSVIATALSCASAKKQMQLVTMITIKMEKTVALAMSLSGKRMVSSSAA